MAQPRALFFDVFGTVVDWRSGIIRELAAWGADAGVTADWPEVADGWRGLYQPAMQRIRSGERGFIRLDVLHEENLVEVFRAHDLAEPQGDERRRLITAWHRLDPWEDAVAGLTRLKAKHIIAPVSNGNISLITNMAKRAGLPWDVVLGAEVAQMYKPAPEAYLRSAAALDLAPSECMMVAAHNDDLRAAREEDLMTAFVPRPLEHGPEGGAEVDATEDWEIVASDFLELADQLGC